MTYIILIVHQMDDVDVIVFGQTEYVSPQSCCSTAVKLIK